jgi:endonuclease III
VQRPRNLSHLRGTGDSTLVPPPFGSRRPPKATIHAVCRRLEVQYGSPRLGNPVEPVDDLFYILISNRTAPSVATRVYEDLKTQYGNWNSLPSTPSMVLERKLTPAGLARKRAAHMLGIANALADRFGTVTLAPLETMQTAPAELFLRSLPGISEKVAKCVLLYGFNRSVLPVDVHVHRVTARLYWHAFRRADQSHSTLEELIPAELRYGFHTNAVAHGRAVCRPRAPKCAQCVIFRYCPYGNEMMTLEQPSSPK